MFKKILIFTLLLLATASAYIYWGYSNKRTLITPYPYAIDQSYDQKYTAKHQEEIKAAQEAKILILGDRMGKSLLPFEKSIEEEFQGKLKTPPKIYNWSTANEPFFRTLYKLKKLKVLPPIIVYFGASSEGFEKKFNVMNKEAILRNFASFDDEKIISLIITFPWFSKIFYESISYFDLKEPKEYKNDLSPPKKLDEKEINFKLFEYELKEMISYIKDKRSTLILFTTPINLEIEPKEVCAHASLSDMVELQQEITNEISAGSFKSAYPKARELASSSFSNALSFYLLGKAALGVGDIKEARDALLKASVFDCSSWRGNAVYNAIIKKEAAKALVQVVDFDQFMSSQLSKEGLFFDELYPQILFYQTMVKELSDNVKKILSVGQ